MENELKDYMLTEDQSNPHLNSIINLVLDRLTTGHPYRAGGLFDQPYFLVHYVERWVREGMEELRAARRLPESVQSVDDLDAHFKLLNLLRGV